MVHVVLMLKDIPAVLTRFVSEMPQDLAAQVSAIMKYRSIGRECSGIITAVLHPEILNATIETGRIMEI